MRHYNNSAIIESKAAQNASEQAFPVETRKLCVLKALIKKKSCLLQAILGTDVQKRQVQPRAIQGEVLGAGDGWRALLRRV